MRIVVTPLEGDELEFDSIPWDLVQVESRYKCNATEGLTYTQIMFLAFSAGKRQRLIEDGLGFDAWGKSVREVEAVAGIDPLATSESTSPDSL